MSYRDGIDAQSAKFLHTWTRPKHQKSQVNGQTRGTVSSIILRTNAKAHRW
ncbi:MULTISPECIES: YpzG family protein [Neobacillus]|uniref:YpzG family protein n=2 Tax=Neobacillus TaxID=2675232 RepID=A0A6B3TMC1_9BACI|nr:MULTISPECIES: YpzG family protein [Neobacillus]MCD4839194.1 YpzG family protein [Neobacillus sedimentimangrovi]MED3624036.1 YpzG family protein [Neobacillus thermocopriae]MED3713769.1 YpzG family protein [Neobacillus thermocopriae]NEX78085.1 YpzG family protein [Neobacillus thermocopriae]